MGALYLIPDPLRLRESLALAAEYGARLEYNDFYAPALLDDPEAWIEMWTGETKFCFGMSKGLYYQQYLFDINTGLIEETFIL